jgi:hypothetical protein
MKGRRYGDFSMQENEIKEKKIWDCVERISELLSCLKDL